MRLTSIVHLEEDHYVALCPELDVVSQGDTAGEAAQNLREACQLFLEHACEDEIRCRLESPVQVTCFDAVVPSAPAAARDEIAGNGTAPGDEVAPGGGDAAGGAA